MGDGVSIKVKGLDEALAKLNATKAAAMKLRAAKAGARVLQAAIEANTPVSTQWSDGSDALPPGFMRSDVAISTVKGTAKSDNPVVSVHFGRLSAHIARFLEFGFTLTGHKPNKKKVRLISTRMGFARSAFDTSQSDITDAIKASLEADMQKAFATGEEPKE
jgi:Bacteriophage HK97-gp10, putative tail-component